jgi:peroxiredoxin
MPNYRRFWWVAGGLLAPALAFALVARLAPSRAATPAPVRGELGQRVPDFMLSDTSGKPVSLYGYAGQKAVVLAFTGTDCPVGNLYMPRLKALAERYAARGVAFVAVNSNTNTTPAEAVRHAKWYGISFPVLMDPAQKAAGIVGATRVNEVAIIDGRATLRYRGAIDDQYDFTARKPAPTKNYLTDALEGVLKGGDATFPVTAVAGCLFDRGAGEPTKAATDELPPVGKVTWAKEVAPILQEKCQSCHRPTQIAPFPLLTYDDAKRWSAMISEVVKEKRMPPWHAEPGVGEFANDRSLTPRERATLTAWHEQNAPLGDPKAAPAPKTFADGWLIGKPDMILTMPTPYTVKAEGTLPYQWFTVPTGFTSDRWIQAVQVKPGERAVVHHVLVFVDDKKGGGRMRSQLAAYVPGDVPSVYPRGVAKKIPAGADILLQVHYTPVGKPTADQTSVGLVFAKEPPRQEANTFGFFKLDLRIPPNAPDVRMEKEMTVPADVRLLSIWPHMHLRGKSFSLAATYPDGRAETLLFVPRYDFNWQTRYELKTPKTLPRGTRLRMTATFDNSPANPHNPNPNASVRWGEQTDDEMLIGYLDYVTETGAKLRPTPLRDRLRQRRGSGE